MALFRKNRLIPRSEVVGKLGLTLLRECTKSANSTDWGKTSRQRRENGSEINRRFKAMDRKMTTWFLGLMGLVVVKGGFDFFSDKDRALLNLIQERS